MLNKIVIMGRLVRDPSTRFTQNQTPVTSFTLAVDRDRKGADGEKETDFIDCTAFRHTAEFLQTYVKKGTLVVAEGRLQIRSWIGNDEKKRTAPEVIVDSVYFGESKRKSADPDERPPMPGDDDAPPDINNAPPRDLDALMQNFPNNVQYADLNDGDGEFPF